MSKVTFLGAIILLFWLFCSPSYANDSLYDPNNTSQVQECLDKASGVTSKMRDCVQIEYDRLDKILNYYYKKIMNSTINEKKRKDVKKDIKEMELKWLAYRQQAMKVLDECTTNTGSAGGMFVMFVLNDIIQAQAAVLRNLYNEIENSVPYDDFESIEKDMQNLDF